MELDRKLVFRLMLGEERDAHERTSCQVLTTPFNVPFSALASIAASTDSTVSHGLLLRPQHHEVSSHPVWRPVRLAFGM